MKRLLAVLALSLLGSEFGWKNVAYADGAPVSSRSSRAFDAALPRGDAALAEGRSAAAVRAFEQARRLAPQDPRPVTRLADLFLPRPEAVIRARGDRAASARIVRARRLLENVLLANTSDDSSTRQARALLRWARAVQGELAAMIEEAEREVRPEDAVSAGELRRLATLSLIDRDLALAERALIAARRALPSDSELLAELGAVYLAQGRAPDAVRVFETVVQRRPGDLEALRDLAGARAAAGDPSRAAALLAHVAAQLPGRADVLLDLARARLEAGERAGAISAAREAIPHLAADDASGHVLLGRALMLDRQSEDAREAFRTALARNPNEPEARAALSAQ